MKTDVTANTVMSARSAACAALLRCESDGAYITLVTPAIAAALPDLRDRRLAVALAYGVRERQVTLDFVGGRLLARSVRELAPHTRALLRLALYQLMYMDKIPPYAIVDETVSLGLHRGERALLNAVLRRAVREHDTLCDPPSRERDPKRADAVAYAMPLPVVRRLYEELGEEHARRVMAAFDAPPTLTLRVNPARGDRDSLTADLTAAGFMPATRPDAPDALILTGSAVPEELPGFHEGRFFIQDVSSQMAVAALCPKPGARILDVCACPGGKTFSALCIAGTGAVAYAADLHESKLSLLRDTAARLGLTDALRVLCARDARDPIPAEWGQFDAVICDVPCSGLGILGKKPDLRHRDMSGDAALPELQRSILCQAATAVAPGGALMYATCTLRHAENGAVTSAFLADHPAFTRRDERTFYPDTDGCDGFYYCVLERRA